jgi:hypothetical protein
MVGTGGAVTGVPLTAPVGSGVALLAGIPVLTPDVVDVGAGVNVARDVGVAVNVVGAGVNVALDVAVAVNVASDVGASVDATMGSDCTSPFSSYPCFPSQAESKRRR